MIRLINAGITPPPAHGQAGLRESKSVESSPITPAAAQLQPIPPVRPVASYIGGKRNLSKRIIQIINATPHDLYAEAFVGMGGVFFRRNRRPRVEVINDISADVTTLFRILQRHYPQFLETLKWQLSSRADFDRLMKVDPTTLTDLERSARFLYLQRQAFGGKVTGRHYGVNRTAPARFDLTKLVPMLEDVHDRLAPVSIERLPYADFIRRYDRPGALFYLDPPYWGCEADYGEGMFDRAEFGVMADDLAKLKGRFILSLNDTPDVRRIFARFAIAEEKVTYTVGGGAKARSAAELVISN